MNKHNFFPDLETGMVDYSVKLTLFNRIGTNGEEKQQVIIESDLRSDIFDSILGELMKK